MGLPLARQHCESRYSPQCTRTGGGGRLEPRSLGLSPLSASGLSSLISVTQFSAFVQEDFLNKAAFIYFMFK